MRPIATDGVEWSVSVGHVRLSPAKTAEPIEMPFGEMAHACLKEPFIRRGVQIFLQKGAIFGGCTVH